MDNWWIILIVLVVWFALNLFILPKLGVST